MSDLRRQEFSDFVAAVEPKLRRALVAVYGHEVRREATAEALGWAWEHWDHMQGIKNQVAYLFRVGQSRRRSRKEPVVFVRPLTPEPWIEPGLGPALASLPERQRMTVVLVYGFGWTLREVAEITGTRIPTVQTHLTRGIDKLRTVLKVNDYA